jgi:hypothetical protein
VIKDTKDEKRLLESDFKNEYGNETTLDLEEQDIELDSPNKSSRDDFSRVLIEKHPNLTTTMDNSFKELKKLSKFGRESSSKVSLALL